MSAPIGLVLARTQRAIDAAFEAEFAAQGVSRRQWQLLSTLVSAPSTSEELAEAVRPFLGEGRDVSAELDALHERDAVEQVDGSWRLSAEGRALADRLGVSVGGIRTRMAAGLTRQDYDRTLIVLERMAVNLERD